MITAGTVSADDIRVDDLEAGSVTCQRLIAKRLQTPELFAFESAAVSCFLSSAYVATGKLTVALSEIDEVKADEAIHLKPRKRSLFRLLLVSALRSFWTSMTARLQKTEVMDADFEPIKKDEEPADEELNRFIGMFKLARESGYTLKLIPGTPEENAPVFDVKTEKNITFAELQQVRKRLAQAIGDARLLLMEAEEYQTAKTAAMLQSGLLGFDLMSNVYRPVYDAIQNFIKEFPVDGTTNAAVIGRLMNNVKLGYYPTSGS